MGWIARLLKGNESSRARLEAETAREKVEQEARTFERWLAALGGDGGATRAAALEHLRAAGSAAEKGDLAGWNEARERCEQARLAYCQGRAALARAHPGKAALLLLDEASQLAAEIRDLEDRSARAADLGEFQAQCGDVEGAERTLATASEPADRARVERALAIARVRSGALDLARLERELAAADPDGWSLEEVLLAVAEDRCRRGDVGGAEAVLASIDDPDSQGTVRRLLAQTAARRGRWDEARSIAGAIEHPHWSGAAWSDIALAQAERGDVQGARQTAESIRDDDWRATALGGLAGALARAGDAGGATELVEEIADAHLRDDARLWIVEARAGRGDFTGALESIARIEDGPLRARELVTLAELARGAGRSELAGDFLQRGLETAEAMRAASGLPPAWLAQFLVDARARMAEFEAAEAAIQAIGGERQRAELLAGLAFHVARHGTGGVVSLEGLLERHASVLERLAILQHGARGLLSLAESKPASSAGAPTG